MYCVVGRVGAAQLRATVIASSSYKSICTKKNLHHALPAGSVLYGTHAIPLGREDHFIYNLLGVELCHSSGGEDPMHHVDTHTGLLVHCTVLNVKNSLCHFPQLGKRTCRLLLLASLAVLRIHDILVGSGSRDPDPHPRIHASD